jgi:cytochrome c-type biogenesis protein
MTFSLGLVFLAGLISFLSPCVLSMLPIYLGILGTNSTDSRHVLLIPGLIFILGFTLVFITLGLTTTLIGNLLFTLKPWIARVGGFLILVYGIHLTGLIHLPFLDYDWKPIQTSSKSNPLLNAFFMGIVFSAGWSPCIGPILGGILTALASSQASSAQGILYLLVYSLGIGIPFLLAAAGLQPAIMRLRQKPMTVLRIQQFSGVLLCIFGVLLMLGIISRLALFSPKWLI